MTAPTLLEKLEGLRVGDHRPRSRADIIRNGVLDEAIGIVREHEAEPPNASADVVEQVAKAIHSKDDIAALCIFFAVLLAAIGSDGWGWLLFIAVLCL